MSTWPVASSVMTKAPLPFYTWCNFSKSWMSEHRHKAASKLRIAPSDYNDFGGLHARAKFCPPKHVVRAQMNCNHSQMKYLQISEGLALWVMVPKVASQSLLAALEGHLLASVAEHDQWDLTNVPFIDEAKTGDEAKAAKAFAFVRHPVARFVSGYQMVMRHLVWFLQIKPISELRDCVTKKLLDVVSMREPSRFRRFVNLFFRNGFNILGLYRCPFSTCLMNHVLPQSWFLNKWQGSYAFIGHLESRKMSLKRLCRLLGTNVSLPHNNPNDAKWAGELQRERQSLQKVHDYFREEMHWLGYKALPGFH